MTAFVTDRDGNHVSDANWGDPDLSGIRLEAYGSHDWSERITIAGGLTGPRYVQDGRGGVGDVKTGRSLFPAGKPAVGYCPVQAEADEHGKLVHELTAQR